MHCDGNAETKPTGAAQGEGQRLAVTVAITAAAAGLGRLGHAQSVPCKLALISSDYLFFGISINDNVRDASKDNLY